eukprot:4154507-Alexandrium_andersonii.AAC.1
MEARDSRPRHCPGSTRDSWPKGLLGLAADAWLEEVLGLTADVPRNGPPDSRPKLCAMSS